MPSRPFQAGTAIGILAKDGIVLAAERKVTSKLLEQDTSAEKLYILNEYETPPPPPPPPPSSPSSVSSGKLV